MPRLSPEGRTALLYRQGKAPAPPAHLDAKAKVLWRQITHAYPADYFAPGSEQLLETFVVSVAMHRFYQSMWKDDPGNPEYAKALSMIANTMNQTAQKLRISNSARFHKRSGIYDETDTRPVDEENVLLFGVGPTRF